MKQEKYKKIKILYILPRLTIGGAERLIIDVAKNINKSLFDVKIIFLKENKGQEIADWEDELKKNNIPIIIVGKNNKLGIIHLLNLYKILKKEKVSIIHTSLFGAVIFGTIAAKLAGVKYVITTIHGLESYNVIKKFLSIIIFRINNKVIAISKALKKHLLSYYKVNNKKIKLIYNGINVDEFIYKNRNYNKKERIRVGFVGRLEKVKGPDYLLQALKHLKNENFICYIAGEGSLKKYLLEVVEKLNLKNKVKFIGWQKDVSSFLKKIDIFVLSSRNEGLGLAILEAGLSGLPVVASRVGGIKDIIDDKKNGLLFRKGDVNNLTKKINYLIENNKERERLGKSLQKKIVKNFDIKDTVKHYEEIYKNFFIKK
jgi:glycosyltransferase involved in cell wall biosynthesis